ncbi:hypothetical protein BKA56DRAFT_229160 [Ilyonectria sp. MPI-CAGE-AT-0026]|nr:hypothetical protein BKA56DRAFT_229160 [Ilyonectria sp. MPI-CAGE-AT-0026]
MLPQRPRRNNNRREPYGRNGNSRRQGQGQNSSQHQGGGARQQYFRGFTQGFTQGFAEGVALSQGQHQESGQHTNQHQAQDVGEDHTQSFAECLEKGYERGFAQGFAQSQAQAQDSNQTSNVSDGPDVADVADVSDFDGRNASQPVPNSAPSFVTDKDGYIQTPGVTFELLKGGYFLRSRYANQVVQVCEMAAQQSNIGQFSVIVRPINEMRSAGCQPAENITWLRETDPNTGSISYHPRPNDGSSGHEEPQ